MAKIYQLMIGRKQINDLYYDEDDARENAMQIAIDTGDPVEIWAAEEHAVIPVDLLNWRLIRIFVVEEEEEEEEL